MRKATIHLYYMDSLLTLKMSWQNFISSFENTLLLVWTAKKTTLMIKTNQQMPESTLAVARWRISSCVGSEDEKAETNPSLSKCWNSFFWKQPRSEPHRLFNQTRKLSNVPNCLFSSSHPPPHVRARETMAQQLGRSAKAMLLGQLATSTQYDESTTDIKSHLPLAKGKSVWGPANAFASGFKPASLGDEGAPWTVAAYDACAHGWLGAWNEAVQSPRLLARLFFTFWRIMTVVRQ